MKVLILDDYYPPFLDWAYRTNSGLARLPYAKQWRALMDHCFGTADFYSRNLAAAGIEAHEVVVNCTQLQMKWAEENVSKRKLRLGRAWKTWIVREQVRNLRPDLIYVQNVTNFSASFLESLRDTAKWIVGQTAYAMDWKYDLGVYDLILSSFPHFVERLGEIGVASELLKIGFEPTVRDRIDLSAERDLAVSFVGTIHHPQRPPEFLVEVAYRLPIKVWGHAGSTFPENSPLARFYEGEAWGLEMYQVHSRSKIALNRHSSVAQNYANNMRMYETTGMGACLVTDAKRNLGDFFEIDREIVAYESTDDLVEKAEYLLDHEQERAGIAEAGMKRTLAEHTYSHRMQELASIFERRLPGKARERRYPSNRQQPAPRFDFEAVKDIVRETPFAPLGRWALRRLDAFRPTQDISAGHRVIQPKEVDGDLIAGWQNPTIPGAQWSVVRDELQRMYSGDVIAAFQVAADALKLTGLEEPLVVEVGCAGGYYSEVLEHLLGFPIQYVGLDYSCPLVHQAAKHYPNRAFVAGDATRLPMREATCDVLFSPGVIMHIPDYPAAITEAFRVSREWAIFHRTPVTSGSTTFMTKKAYGVPVVELVFSEDELQSILEQKGEISKELLIDSYDLPGFDTKVHMKTYVCRKH